ncbi:cyclin-like protein [Dacryopinax primogenitus]|uniref:Cyclin-like protein n=1 Tax=Dacryopinax primogenitus (strain DJM 731) TaxID=1858805 RepID=M5FNX8_DACPD|nr:cyclin-like protein [Dacryopinax primogenitus]EJT96628.1 cyclin-like protein [Dacryopinax primogenitus]
MTGLPEELLQWLFTPSALYHTPSQVDGYGLHQELVERARGIEFLFRVGLQLGMHQHTMSAAAVYFHRFYMRYSFVDYHRFEIAATCLFLAGKTEENLRKLHDVAGAVIIKLHRSSSSSQNTTDLLKAHEREVARFEHLIAVYELLLADALAFDLEVSHVQGILVIALDALLAPEEVADLAWTIANDALYTPLCVLQSAEIIAAACYLLALALLQQPSLPWEQYLAPLSSPSLEQERWRSAFRLSSSDMLGVRDSISVLLEFWTSLDEDTRKQFNSKLEDIPLHVKHLTRPEEGRTLASYAPSMNPRNGENGTNGIGGEGTPWQSQGSGTPWAEGKGSPFAMTAPSMPTSQSYEEGEEGEDRAPMETRTPMGRGSPWVTTPSA